MPLLKDEIATLTVQTHLAQFPEDLQKFCTLADKFFSFTRANLEAVDSDIDDVSDVFSFGFSFARESGPQNVYMLELFDQKGRDFFLFFKMSSKTREEFHEWLVDNFDIDFGTDEEG